MANRVIGPGISLPPPQLLYPASLTNVPFTQGSNVLSLAPGQSVQIPAGDWIIDLGKYSILEFQDPVQSGSISQTSGVWRPIRSQRGTFKIFSDGVNYRISNLLGCVVGGVVTKGGTGYVQASTVVTPSVGNSTWQAIVGGRVTLPTCSIVGAGYGVAPIVYIPAPPAPGIAASAIATITAGAISGITMINEGAGYTAAPAITILPNPFDPNIGSITAAVAAAALTGAGIVNGVLLTNSGAPVASTMTLTITGGDNSATITPVFLTTLTALTAVAVGSGSITGAALTTIGGLSTAVPVFTSSNDFIPRQAQVQLSINAGQMTASTIIDGGMFLGTVSPIIQTYGGVSLIAPTVTLTQGSANDTITIQPA